MIQSQYQDVKFTFAGLRIFQNNAVMPSTSQCDGGGAKTAGSRPAEHQQLPDNTELMPAANATVAELYGIVGSPSTSGHEPASTGQHSQGIATRSFDLDQPGFLRLRDVLAIFPVSRASWYSGIVKGIYPNPVPLGLRSVGWRTSDIKALIENPSAISTSAIAGSLEIKSKRKGGFTT